MSTTQTFELIQLVSLMNGELYLDVSENDVQQIVAHVLGAVDPESPDYEYAKREAAEYIADNHPRLVEASAIALKNKSFARQHYNSLINLYRMRHDIGQMERVPA